MPIDSKVSRHCVLVKFSTAVMKHHYQKESWGGKGLFCLPYALLFLTEGSEDRNSNREETRGQS